MKRNTFALLALVMAVALFAFPIGVQAAGVMPPRTIPVTGSGLVELSVQQVNNLVLKSGDMVSLPGFSAAGVKAAMSSETAKSLPAALPEELHFVDALSISLVRDGKSVDALPAEMAVSFAEEPEKISFECDRSITILRWDDANGWVEIAEHTLETTSKLPGLFVLAVK